MSNRTILITGAAKRLGKFLAITFSKIGYDIALHYNSSKKEALEVQKIIQSNNVRCHIFQSDLQNIQNCKKLVTDVKTYFGKIDILINNSSVFLEGNFQNTTEEIFDENFNVNYKSIFFLSQEFSKNNCGNIINILDTYIRKRSKRFFTYLSSKKNLEILTQDMALELAPKVRVNAISPGIFLPAYEFSQEYIDNKSKNTPLNYKIKKEDIFKTIDFLINSNFLTGQIIFIDSGQNLTN